MMQAHHHNPGAGARRSIAVLAMACTVLTACEPEPERVAAFKLRSYDIPLSWADNEGTEGWRRARVEMEDRTYQGAGADRPFMDDPVGMPAWENWGEEWDIEVVYRDNPVTGSAQAHFSRLVARRKLTEWFVLDDLGQHHLQAVTDDGGFFSNELRTEFRCRSPRVCATLQKLADDKALRATLQVEHPDNLSHPQLITDAALSYRLGGDDGRQKLPL